MILYSPYPSCSFGRFSHSHSSNRKMAGDDYTLHQAALLLESWNCGRETADRKDWHWLSCTTGHRRLIKDLVYTCEYPLVWLWLFLEVMRKAVSLELAGTMKRSCGSFAAWESDWIGWEIGWLLRKRSGFRFSVLIFLKYRSYNGLRVGTQAQTMMRRSSTLWTIRR